MSVPTKSRVKLPNRPYQVVRPRRPAPGKLTQEPGFKPVKSKKPHKNKPDYFDKKD